MKKKNGLYGTLFRYYWLYFSKNKSCLKLDSTMALGSEQRNNGIRRKSEAARRNGNERMRMQAGTVVVGEERGTEAAGRAGFGYSCILLKFFHIDIINIILMFHRFII